MEPCACADIAHRFAGERRCHRRTVAEMGRGRRWVGEGEVGGWERRRDRKGSCRSAKGSWGTGAGRAAAQSSVRPRARGAARKRYVRVECTA